MKISPALAIFFICNLIFAEEVKEKILTVYSDETRAEDSGEIPSPDKKYAVRLRGTPEYFKFGVVIIDTKSKGTIFSYDPHSRAILPSWSPNSKFLAIDKSIGPHVSGLDIFKVTKNSTIKVKWPKEFASAKYSDEATGKIDFINIVDRLLHKEDQGKQSLKGGGLEKIKWKTDNDVIVTLKCFFVDSVIDERHRKILDAEYEMTIHCNDDNTSSLINVKEVKYDKTDESW